MISPLFRRNFTNAIAALWATWRSSVLADGGTIQINKAIWIEQFEPIQTFDWSYIAGAGKASVAYATVPNDVTDRTKDLSISSGGRWVRGSNGLYAFVAANVPAHEYDFQGNYMGVAVFQATVNLALHRRNMNNAVWVATNITPTLTLAGANGGVNEATRLTATGASGTILQSFTGASAARTYSCLIRRISGTGTIEITADGTNWKNVTADLTSDTYKLVFDTRTALNPSFGIRMGTSGDVIDVDFNQFEAGDTATVRTETSDSGSQGSTVTRVVTNILRTGASGYTGQTQGTIYLEFTITNLTGPYRRVFGISDGTLNNVIQVAINNLGFLEFYITTGGVSQTAFFGTAYSLGINKVAIGYDTNDVVLYRNGAQLTTDTSVSVPACNAIYVGQRPQGAGGLDTFNNHFICAALDNVRMPNAELATKTTL